MEQATFEGTLTHLIHSEAQGSKLTLASSHFASEFHQTASAK